MAREFNIMGLDVVLTDNRVLSPNELWSIRAIAETFNHPSNEVLMAEKLNANALAEKNLKDCPLTVEEQAEMFVPEFPVKNRDKRAKSRNGKALEGRKHKGCANSNYGWKKYNNFCKEHDRKVSKRNFKEHWQEELPEYWDACDQWYDEEELPEHEYDWDYVEEKKFEIARECSYNKGYNLGYHEGFEAGQKYILDLLKQVGVNVNLETLIEQNLKW